MKFSKMQVNENKLSFKINNSSTAFVNALRQTIVEEVPSMAISEVDVYENVSSLFDEYIAHRLGMIPLSTEPGMYTLAKDCCGGNCNKCSTTLTLEVVGPKMVYSGDLIPKDKKVKPIYDNIPIIKLAENEKLKLEAKATSGTARQHARWQAALASYKMQPIIEIDAKNSKDCMNVIESCPVKILEKTKTMIKVLDEDACIECKECQKLCPEGIKISHSKKDFIFNIESYTNIKPKEILSMALEILSEKTKDIEKQLKK